MTTMDRRFISFLLIIVVAIVVILADCEREAYAHDGSRWGCIAHYESTHRWRINTGNGYYGGLQFSLQSWRYYGGPKITGNEYPHRATKREQIQVARNLTWEGWGGHAPQGGHAGWPNNWSRCS